MGKISYDGQYQPLNDRHGDAWPSAALLELCDTCFRLSRMTVMECEAVWLGEDEGLKKRAMSKMSGSSALTEKFLQSELGHVPH